MGRLSKRLAKFVHIQGNSSLDLKILLLELDYLFRLRQIPLYMKGTLLLPHDPQDHQFDRNNYMKFPF